MNRWNVGTLLLLCGYVVVGAELIDSWTGSAAHATEASTFLPTQRLACVIEVDGYNRDRYVRQEVAVECPPEFSTHPWGNWGVDSNLSYRWDGSQYQGWKSTESHVEWNSCTQGDWGHPGPSYFNANYPSWDEQETTTGDNRYGSITFQLFPDNENNGCSELDGYNLTFYNNWFEAYELDDFPGNPDDFVDSMTFGSLTIPLTCNYGGCNLSWSNARWKLGNAGLISHEIQAKIVDSFLDWVDEPEECDPCEV